MGIYNWISEKTALKLGIEYPMRYDAILFKGNKTVHAYIGELKNKDNLEKTSHIVIMELFGLNEGNRSRYFLVKFTDKPRSQLDVMERLNYEMRLERLCCNKNRIQAPYLESKILDTIKEINKI